MNKLRETKEGKKKKGRRKEERKKMKKAREADKKKYINKGVRVCRVWVNERMRECGCVSIMMVRQGLLLSSILTMGLVHN